MGRRHYRKKQPTIKFYRYNQHIRVPKVQLIDHQGNFVGIILTQEALQRAQDQNLDLIEVSPKENPPVAKILDLGKFKYNLEKKKLKTKPKKSSEIKGIRLTLNMATHDLETKQKQTRKFIEQGSRIQIEMFLRGRQIIHSHRAYQQIITFIQNFAEITETVQPVNRKGQRFTTILQPKKIT